MATKTKLEQAVEEQASSLNDARREIVLSQFSIYKQNKARMLEINSSLKMFAKKTASTGDEAKAMSLSYEYRQLATANSRIASELFDLLGER